MRSSPLTHEEFLARRRFGSLDGLRAIAILLVFTAHPRNPWWERFNGPNGVTLFFCLSGFLITTLLLREEAARGRVDFAGFYVRRLFRIYPAFLGVFALYCVLVLGFGLQPERRDVFVENIPWVLLFVPEHMHFSVVGGLYPPFNGVWSIGIEEKFYLVWPVVAFALVAARRSLRVPVLAVAAVLSVALGLLPGGDYVSPYQHLAYGALAALLLHAPASYPRLATLGRPPVLAGLVVVALVVQFGSPHLGSDHLAYTLSGLSFAAVLVGLVTTRTRRADWLASRPMVFLAAISYVFYLLHNLVLNLVEMVVPEVWGLPGSFLSAGIALVLSVLVSWAAHRLYEEPMRLVGVRWSRRLRERAAARRTAETPVAELDPRAP